MKVVIFAVILSLSALSGCGSDEPTTDTSAADVVHTDTAPTPVELTNALTVTDFVSQEPIEGVTLCTNIEGAECVTTDAAGKASFTASVVPGQLIQLRADKDGYFGFLSEGIIPEGVEAGTLETSWPMAGAGVIDLIVGALETEVDETKGHFTVVVVGPEGDGGERPFMEGATVTATGNAQAGPKYLQPAGDISAGLFGDDAAGTTSAGLAAFFNVDVGTVDLTVTLAGHDCSVGGSGLPSDTGSARATIEAGRATYIAVICEPTP